MATTETTAVNLALQEQGNAPESSIPQGDWIKEQVTVRSYWKWITKKVRNKKTGVVTEKTVPTFIARAASEGQANWKAIEEKKDSHGNPEWTFFSENSFTRHVVKTMNAFYALVKEQEDWDQRAYVANAGIGYSQNSTQNSLATEYKDKTGVDGVPPVPVHQQEDIDLAPYINEKPGRKVKTMDEKVRDMLLKSGMDPSRIALFLQSLQTEFATAAASGVALPEGEEEEEEEEGEEEENETPAN